MALLDKGLKQRMVGALVLVALAVIFLPMLLSREDEMRRVVVDAPSMPQAPATAEIVVQPAEVVEPEVLPQEPVPLDEVAPRIVEVPEQPTPTPPPVVQPSRPEQAKPEQATAAPSKPDSRLDANSLPISWSCNWPACPAVRVQRICRRPCAVRATTPISALSMA